MSQYGEAYEAALERGDFTTVASILHEATHDPKLNEELEAIDARLHAQITEDRLRLVKRYPHDRT